MTDREPIDVALVVMEWLKADLATRFPTLSVVLELPSNWTLGSDPVLVVADDGDPLVVWPATSPTIRVTSWTSGRDRTYIHAALARLLSKTPIPGIAAILPGTGVLEARDAKTRGDLASFTVLTRARTAVPQS